MSGLNRKDLALAICRHVPPCASSEEHEAESRPPATQPATPATETAPLSGYGIRACRGHWHVVSHSEGFDSEDIAVDGDPFASAEEALAAADRANRGDFSRGSVQESGTPEPRCKSHLMVSETSTAQCILERGHALPHRISGSGTTTATPTREEFEEIVKRVQPDSVFTANFPYANRKDSIWLVSEVRRLRSEVARTTELLKASDISFASALESVARITSEAKGWRESYVEQCKITARITSERDAGRKFVEWCMGDNSWLGCDLDGGDVQDKAQELGLIVEVPADAEFREEYDSDTMFVVAWNASRTLEEGSSAD